MTSTTITEIEAWQCHVELPSPIDLGPIIVRKREYLALRVKTSDGLVADCVTQVRGSPIDVVITDLLGPKLLKRDATDLAAINADVRRSLTAMESDGAVGRAWSALEICLQDLRAQAAGWPLWKLLGGLGRPVPVALVEGYSLQGETDDEFVSRVVGAAGEGYRLIKIEAGHYADFGELLDRLSAITEQVGSDVQFVLDLAWTWNRAKDRSEYLRRLEGFNIAWIEDMFYRTKVDSYRRLRDSTRMPIACGDEVTRPEDIRALIDAGAVDLVRLDATTMGGFDAVRQLADHALARQLGVSFHVSPEVHQHCVFGFPSADHIEIFPTNRPFDATHQLICENVYARIENGMLAPPSGPGSGLVLNDEAVNRFSVRHGSVKS